MKALSEFKITKSQVEHISNNLRTLLNKRSVSESQIAHALKIPVMTVRRIVSGETTDPRISTLKLLADYFDTSIDSLVGSQDSLHIEASHKMPTFVPILDWKVLSEISSIQDIALNEWKTWHPIALGDQYILSKNAFALDSRPSMQPRFPKGTLFIIDPSETPADADIVLVKMKKDNELSLRELIIDPPKWQLQPVVAGSEAIFYSKEQQEIIGVVILTFLYAR